LVFLSAVAVFSINPIRIGGSGEAKTDSFGYQVGLVLPVLHDLREGLPVIVLGIELL